MPALEEYDVFSYLYRAFVVAMLIFVLLPALVIFGTSLTQTQYVIFPPQGITAHWYRLLLRSDEWQMAMLNSVIIALAAAFVSGVLGTMSAYALDRQEIPKSGLFYGLFAVPIILPPIILAIGFLNLFAQFGLTGTYIAIILAHGVFTMPFPFLLVSNGLAEIDPQVEEASMTLGADRITTLRKITLPLVRSNIVAGYIFAFVISLNEYIIAQIVVGLSITTFPIKIFNSLRYSLTPAISSTSVVVIVVTAILVYIVDKMSSGLWN
ncbi:MAG: ABC transporter permease [Halobacteriaceae archaeon]